MTSFRFSERVVVIPLVRTSVTRSWLRWGSEKKREEQELLELYNQAAEAYAEWRKSEPFDEIIARLPDDDLAINLLSCEDYLFGIEAELEHLDLKGMVDLRDRLRTQLRFLADPERVLAPLIDFITLIVDGLARDLPALGDSPFQVTLADLYGNDVIEKIIGTFGSHGDELVDLNILSSMWNQFHVNLCMASGISPDVEVAKYVMPSASKLPPGKAAEVYLAHTPFLEHFERPAAIDVPEETYFSHMHLIGGSGAGKTQFLGQFILHHLRSDTQPSLVVVDSHGDLIPKLRQLADIQDRLVYIDPRHPPSVNLFSVDMFDYLFSGIVGADLTAKQSVFFRFLARLMHAVPNATMLDLLYALDDITQYQSAVDTLPTLQKAFFAKDFDSKTFAPTKDQIRYRINSLVEHPTMEKLFTTGTNEIDIGAVLDRGSVLLIDTSKEYLKTASPHFGRIFISLVLQAVLDRAAIDARDRHPALLIVDEAAEYFDRNMDDLLVSVRKYKCGCVFAHQYLDQCNASLRASLAANTSIKMVSGVSMSDARSLAPDLRTTPDFILAQKKLQFACYIRNVTPSAVSIPVMPGLLDAEEKVEYATSRFDEVDEEEFVEASNNVEEEQPAPYTEERTTPPKRDSIDTPSTDATEEW